MKMARASTGRYIISIKSCLRILKLTLLVSAVSVNSGETGNSKDAAAGLRLEIPLQEKKATPMDVAIFTELSPVIVSETPVKLPEKKPKSD